jgi:cytoskeletal protein CcmA (bactofilin family)
MAIFNNGNSRSDASKANSNTTIITAGAKLKGEIELNCNLYIDGELEGTIKSSKEVNIGKSGRVKGTIITEHLVVQGYMEGMVDASTVAIKAKGRVSGEIASNELIIESKGIFEGSSVLKDALPLITKKEENVTASTL